MIKKESQEFCNSVVLSSSLIKESLCRFCFDLWLVLLVCCADAAFVGYFLTSCIVVLVSINLTHQYFKKKKKKLEFFFHIHHYS